MVPNVYTGCVGYKLRCSRYVKMVQDDEAVYRCLFLGIAISLVYHWYLGSFDKLIKNKKYTMDKTFLFTFWHYYWQYLPTNQWNQHAKNAKNQVIRLRDERVKIFIIFQYPPTYKPDQNLFPVRFPPKEESQLSSLMDTKFRTTFPSFISLVEFLHWATFKRQWSRESLNPDLVSLRG